MEPKQSFKLSCTPNGSGLDHLLEAFLPEEDKQANVHNTQFSQIFENPRLSELLRLQCEIQLDFGVGNYYIKNSLNKQTQSPLWVVYDLQKNWLKTYPCNFNCGYKKVKLFSVKDYNIGGYDE